MPWNNRALKRASAGAHGYECLHINAARGHVRRHRDAVGVKSRNRLFHAIAVTGQASAQDDDERQWWTATLDNAKRAADTPPPPPPPGHRKPRHSPANAFYASLKARMNALANSRDNAVCEVCTLDSRLDARVRRGRS